MLIRRMTLEDIPEVVEIENQCFSQPWSEKSFQDSLTREDTIFLVCVEDDLVGGEGVMSRVTGYIGLYLSFEEASVTNVASNTTHYFLSACQIILYTHKKNRILSCE